MLHPTCHPIHHSQNLAKTLIPWQKPFISGIVSSPSIFRVTQFPHREITNYRISRRVGSTIKAIGTTDTSTSVKALVTVKVTTGGFLSDITVSGVVDNVADLFGKSILLELVSAELDPKKGLEKPTIKGYAHKLGREGDGVKYECDFDVPEDFGEIGAVLVENEHHTEMFLTNISIDGFSIGHVNVTCNSWVQPKVKSTYKRIFFTNKVSTVSPIIFNM